MNLAGITLPVRVVGAVTFSVLVVGTAAEAALADPSSHLGNYYAQVAVGTRPDDRAGIRGANAPSFASAPAASSTAIRPDDRAGIRGANAPSFRTAPAVSSRVLRPDDRAGARGIGATAVAATGLAAAAGSGFDWVDAGIGAAGTLALMLVGGSVFLIGTRRHGHARGKPPAAALRG